MEYSLKNGKVVIIREPVTEDAKSIIDVISSADKETKFLARNPGEFNLTVNQEKEFISKILTDKDRDLFVAEYDGKIVGNCSVGLVGETERCMHRAEVTFVVLKNYWGLGIGGKLMQHCIQWCKTKNVTQIELCVVEDNIKAIKMYKDFGFKTVGVIPNAFRYQNGSFSNQKLMVLELKNNN